LYFINSLGKKMSWKEHQLRELDCIANEIRLRGKVLNAGADTSPNSDELYYELTDPTGFYGFSSEEAENTISGLSKKL
jgi:hypothetical protein